MTGKASKAAQTPSEVYPVEVALANPHESPVFPPPPPAEILSHRDEYNEILRARVYAIPEDADTDNSLFALYRLYERFVVDNVTAYRNNLERFWKNHQWPVKDIPDPEDPDLPRYAFLACTTMLMVEAFNEKIKLGAVRDALWLAHWYSSGRHDTTAEFAAKLDRI